MKVVQLFKKLFSKKSRKRSAEANNAADNLLRYFSELEHYNFMDGGKKVITRKSLQSFFHQEPALFRNDFITQNGKPLNKIDMFLESKGKQAKGKFLLKNHASLFYLPVAKEDVMRYFASLASEKTFFQDFKAEPDSFLIHVKLDHMLKLSKDESQQKPVVISPIVKFLVQSGKTLENLQDELEKAIQDTIEDESYGRMDNDLTLDGEENSALLKDLKFIHIRYKNWQKVSKVIHGILQSYIEDAHLAEDGVLRFAASPLSDKYETMTYDDFVGINSFYLNDLQTVHTALRHDRVGTALKTYLDADNWESENNIEQQVDFFDNASVSECKRLLRGMPPARWPSKYSLGLMQQVALNLIYEKYQTEKDGFLFSVNGPPGTGKTTLLKDVFSNLLVDKAKFLTSEICILSKMQYGPEAEDTYYAFPSQLKDFRILVVSNNNAAVENISTELPEDEELVNNGYTFFGGRESQWGNISSALGKKANIKSFFKNMRAILDKGIPDIKRSEDSIQQMEELIRRNIKSAAKTEGLDDLENEKWQKSEVQYINIDNGDLVHCDRSKLFGLAMKQYEAFIYDHFEEIKKNMYLAEAYFTGKRNQLTKNMDREKHQSFIQAMFDTIFLLSPVISSTFASVARFLEDVEQEDIGWLFIDEAGQATPQSAVGAIWRSKRAVVVGDPLQIPPVVTLSPDQLKFIASKSIGIDENENYFHRFTRPEASVQEFSDLNNPYGGNLPDNQGNSTWLGCPLRVHRRCANPMFTISNRTTYQQKMLYGTKPRELASDKLYTSHWLHVPGETSRKGDHFVKAQAEEAFKIAKQYREEDPQGECFLITPFVSIRQGLEKMNAELSDSSIKVGTVHTFQGKEAPLVIMVLGVDDAAKGPLRWASATPNLLNVAASRAKEYFVVIGNENTWGKMKYFDVAWEKLKPHG